MFENDIWRALIATLREGLDNQGFSGIAIKQAFQTIKQGPNTQDTVYLFKVSSNRYGYQDQKLEYNAPNFEFDLTESYVMESTYQLNAVTQPDLTDEFALTGFDIVERCSTIMQSQFAINKLRESDISILRVQQIRNPYGMDDREQFDQNSSFDLILSYTRSISSTVPQVNTLEPVFGQF